MIGELQANILDFDVHIYPYWEDVNEGIIRQLPVSTTKDKPAVLDVGCGQGTLAGAIRERGYEVWGVECEHGAVERARPRIDQVVEADLHDYNTVGKVIENKKFDYVIFSDVLEHIYDPLGTLRKYSNYLRPGGRVLVSVPNIANWEARLKLLFGVFNYAPSGVMDRTHIRFLTIKTARKMVEGAGLKVLKVDHTPYILRAFIPLIKKVLAPNGTSTVQTDEEGRRSIIDSPMYKIYQKIVYPIESLLTTIFPGLFTFRIIIVAEKQ